eukprot:COSAG04_NODE_5576_length_1563_cov_0.854508_4_plen_77_part_01
MTRVSHLGQSCGLLLLRPKSLVAELLRLLLGHSQLAVRLRLRSCLSLGLGRPGHPGCLRLGLCRRLCLSVGLGLREL